MQFLKEVSIDYPFKFGFFFTLCTIRIEFGAMDTYMNVMCVSVLFMYIFGCIGNFMHVLGCIGNFDALCLIQANACVMFKVFYESVDELSARLPNGYGMVLGFSQLGEK